MCHIFLILFSERELGEVRGGKTGRGEMRVTEYVLYRKRRGEEGDQKEGERAYGA